MKKHAYLSKFFLFVFLTLSLNAFTQTLDQKKVIISGYDNLKLAELQARFRLKASLDKQAALEFAQQMGIETILNLPDGGYAELQRIEVDGSLIYYSTFNVNASVSTRTNLVNIGGLAGLNLDGQNMTAHIWDAGLARATHQEYDGIGGIDRFSVGDGTTALHYHSAHVTGTIIASGYLAAAKGMAPQAHAIGFDWNYDLSEATTFAQNGMLISNHSYGWNSSSVPDYYFGGYITDSRDWDELHYNAPYYLMVVAAGNDGTTNYNGSPLDPSNPQYDKLTGHSTSKNNMVVANALDASVDSYGNLTSPVTINSSSSQGPTDDLRIKPDITGNGTAVYSTYETADNAYASITGTSMASPNIAGSLLLLQQHAYNVRGSYLRSATLKGVALHTADEAGMTGPDAIYGWGLMNTRRAAEVISQNFNQSIVDELALMSGQTYVVNVESDGVNELVASICWTDPAGVATTVVNSPDARLVNDLDVRITKNGVTYNPWRLTAVNANSTGDNTKDNYERINIMGATGSYTVTVSHKGSLSGGSQNFSLVITGLSSVPVICNATVPTGLAVSNIGSSTVTVSWNPVPAASYDVRYRQVGAQEWLTIAVTGSSTLLTGLTALTQYEVQVRSKCPDYSVSEYTPSVNFTTTEVQLNYCASQGNSVVDEWIGQVAFNSFVNPSGAAGYTNFTNLMVPLTAGGNVALTLTPTFSGSTYTEYWRIWIDYNKDGDFLDANETVFAPTAGSTTTVTGNFTAAAGVSGTTRMRVTMKYGSAPTSPCESFSYGEVEDYTVSFGTAQPPVANFSANPTTVIAGQSVLFTDLSSNGPTSWAWTFNGGTPATSTSQNPSVAYNTAGTYDVTLVATNASGSDSELKTGYITVVVVPSCTNPVSPLNGATGVAVNSTLQWSSVANATGYTLYFGTNNPPTNINNGTNVGNVTTFDPTGDLTMGTVYYWKIVPYNANGSAVGCSVWQFTTVAPSGSVQISYSDFETGLGIWTDGGTDCARYNGPYSHGGLYSMDIQDNSGTSSSFYHTSGVNVATPGYVQLDVRFEFKAISMENNEDFWVQYYNGSTWSTVATFKRGTNFNNSVFYQANVSILESSYIFPANMKIRFVCDASDDNDDVYIDNVMITGSFSSSPNNYIIPLSGPEGGNQDMLADEDTPIKIFPNPAHDKLNISIANSDLSEIFIYDLQGRVVHHEIFTESQQVIGLENFRTGVYMIFIITPDETYKTKFIKN